MSNIVQQIREELIPSRDIPQFSTGDNVNVHYRIIEGDKERIQIYRGDVIYFTGANVSRAFCVRKISNGVGVERVFPINSPLIEKIEVTKRGAVRRAKIYYIRGLKGKKMRIKEKRTS